MAKKKLHLLEAIELLKQDGVHHLRVWKKSNGEIVEYQNAVFIGQHRRGGTIKIKLTHSNQIREFREVFLFELDGMEVYL